MKAIDIIMIAATLTVALSCGQRNTGNNAGEAAEQVGQEISLEEKYAPKIETGTEVQDFTVQTADGKEFRFSSLRGGWVVLDFWASWCGDCREEIPAVKELQAEYSGKGVTFVGFSLDTDSEAWHKCLDESGMDWLQVSNLIKWHDNPVAESFGMGWIPTMFLINPEGRIESYAMTAATMRKNLEKAL